MTRALPSGLTFTERAAIWSDALAPHERLLAGLLVGLYASKSCPLLAREWRHELESELAASWGKPPEAVESFITQVITQKLV